MATSVTSLEPTPSPTAARMRTPRALSLCRSSMVPVTTGRRKIEPTLARRAFPFHGLTVPGVNNDAAGAEGLRGADQCAEIAGILEAGSNEDQRNAPEEILERGTGGTISAAMP